MKITVFGPGYVGLVTAACLANLGNEIICVGVDKKKIARLNKGIIPIFEPGLKELVQLNIKEKRISFTTDAKHGVQSSEVIFIAVGTPQSDSGEAYLGHVFKVAESVGKYINGYKVIVDKSTVPVGTADKVKEVVRKNMHSKHDFDLVSNPEFLREGEAINDFMVPDRIVIGVESKRAEEIMTAVYKPIERTGRPILVTDIKSAELIKYASNAMLATRISFMNQLSHLCEKMGADIKLVAKGMGLDKRIGPRFLHAGIGYGGSCFPKDVQALIYTMNEHGVEAGIFEAVEEANFSQKHVLAEKVRHVMGDKLKGKKLAVWGLAFKPKTDDMREAPSIVIVNELKESGASITAFDPVAEETAKSIIKGIKFVAKPYEALKDADALLVCTEWDEFRSPDWKKMKKLMKGSLIFDGRNIYEPHDVKEAGFKYYSIGRKPV